MEFVTPIIQQVCIMYLLIIVGIVAFRCNLFNRETASQLSSILVKVVTPAVIIQAFQIKFDSNLAKGLLVAATLSIITHLVGILLSLALVRKSGTSRRYLSDRLAIIFSNCGFIGIPLVFAIFGSIGVFYCSMYMAVYNIFLWTYGVSTFNNSFSPRNLLKVFLSPQIIGTIVGILFFLFSVRLPPMLFSANKYIADLNTPLAMIIVGSYIAQTDVFEAIRDMRLYVISLLRILLVPAILLAVLFFWRVDRNIAGAVFISASCPVGAMTMILADQFDADPVHASRLITISTLLSVLSLPVMLTLFHLISA